MIRRAEEADAEALIDVFASVAAEGRWIGTEAGFDREARVDAIRETLQAEDRAIFAAEVDGRIVGWILVAHVYRGLYELSMALLEGHRGQGLGTGLMDAGLAWARERDAHKVTLEVWPHNEAAIRLYRRFGFEVEGRRRRTWRRANGELWDSLVMGLVIDEVGPGSPHADAPGLSPTGPGPGLGT